MQSFANKSANKAAFTAFINNGRKPTASVAASQSPIGKQETVEVAFPATDLTGCLFGYPAETGQWIEKK